MTTRRRGFSVRVFLPDGDPDGVKVVEKSNWAGRGLVIPRAMFADARPPAPRFNLVAKPNDWTKAVREQALSSDPDATPNLRLEYWQAFKAHLEEARSPLKLQAPSTRYWMNLPLGRSDVHLTAIVSMRDECVEAKVYFRGATGPALYRALLEQRSQIDKELGEPPTWEQKDERRACRVLYWRDADPNDRTTWPELHKWTREKLELLDRVFRKRIAALPKGTTAPDTEEA